MGVRQLAGPFPIVNDLGEAPTTIGGWMWLPNIGLVVDTFVNKKGRIAIDGIFQPTGVYTPNVSGGYWAAQHRLTYLKFLGFVEGFTPSCAEYVYDPLALMAKLEVEDVTILLNSTYIKLADRRLYYDGDLRANDLAGVTTIEMSRADLGMPGLNAGSVGPGRHDEEIFIGGSYSGVTQARFYNTTTRLPVGPVWHIPMAAVALTFAPEFGVMISLHSEPWAMNIWSFEVEPVTLSAPEWVPPQPLKEGYLPTFRVQALGADADPCEGELVDWTLESPDSPPSSPPDVRGRLLTTQSTTDAEGYAYVRVRYGAGSAGVTVINASLKC